MNLQSAMSASLELRAVGDGKPLLLLHSLLSDTRAFHRLVPKLGGVRAIIPSLPGYGASPRSEADVFGVARLVVRALDSADVERFDLLGNGYGGFIALALAQQTGARVDRLILVDTAASFTPEGKQGLLAMQSRVKAGGMAAVADAALKRLFPENFIAAEPVIAKEAREALLAFDQAAFLRACQNLIDVDLRAGLPSIKARTLVVVGLEDAATPPELSRELANRIPAARLVELPGCGHAPHIQAPENLATSIREFLAEPATN